MRGLREFHERFPARGAHPALRLPAEGPRPVRRAGEGTGLPLERLRTPEFQERRTLSWGWEGGRARADEGCTGGAEQGVFELGRRSAFWSSSRPTDRGRHEEAGGSPGGAPAAWSPPSEALCRTLLETWSLPEPRAPRRRLLCDTFPDNQPFNQLHPSISSAFLEVRPCIRWVCPSRHQFSLRWTSRLCLNQCRTPDGKAEASIPE